MPAKSRPRRRVQASAEAIERVRQFNRFYTRQLGLLDDGLLGSGFTLTEARVLYELAQRKAPTASDLGRDLGLDAGYLSRILQKFMRRSLLKRTAAASDSRQSLLELTAGGRSAFAPLDRAARAQVGALIAQLSRDQADALLHAMQKIKATLQPDAAPAEFSLRPLRTGDVGWIVHRQALLYAQEYGWDGSYEGLVAEIVGRFIKKFDPQWESCWIAERDGEIVGSVFLVRAAPTIAQLRLLYVEPSSRGCGLGQRLVAQCIRFARKKGYRKLTLWTNDVLASARRIYESAGFRLVKQEQHHSFGKDLVGQTWDLAL